MCWCWRIEGVALEEALAIVFQLILATGWRSSTWRRSAGGQSGWERRRLLYWLVQSIGDEEIKRKKLWKLVRKAVFAFSRSPFSPENMYAFSPENMQCAPGAGVSRGAYDDDLEPRAMLRWTGTACSACSEKGDIDNLGKRECRTRASEQ